MLKDSRSYEVQIIDAVRSVNKALGGTYGTSSAIYKSEFNQYEVQLIDAIKGIGRTLSGKGLSLAGGGVGDLSGYATAAQFQDLSRRVTVLESESFFRLVDGNVTLKEQYQNLWVPGWLAAGGIGSDGGGGGVSYLKELTDVYHDTDGVLRADGTDVQPGDALVYNTTLGWVASPVSGGGGSGTVTGIRMNGNTLSPSTTGIIDLGTVITSLSGYATQQWVQQQGYLTSYTEADPTVPAWAKQSSPDLYIGTTQVQTSSIAQDLTGILSIKASTANASKFEWDSANGAWHFYGNVYADGWMSAGGIGSSGGGGGGGSDVSWGTKSGNTRPLTVYGTTETLLLDGALAGYVTTQALNTALAGYATNLALAGKQDKYPFTISGVSGDTYDLSNFLTSQSIYGLTLSAGIFSPGTYTPNSEAKTFNIPTTLDHIEDGTNRKLSDYVTLHTAQTIDGAKTFAGNPVTIASTSGLSVHASSYIDIGDARLIYDSGAKALHVTYRSGTTQPIGLFADGFVSAGGVAAQTTTRYVTVDGGDQTISGNKTFSGTTQLGQTQIGTIAILGSGTAPYINNTLDRIYIQRAGVTGISMCAVGGQVVIGALNTSNSSKLYVNGDAAFAYASGSTISISEIVNRIAALENR